MLYINKIRRKDTFFMELFLFKKNEEFWDYYLYSIWG